MALPAIFRIPKPRSFFHFVSLRTAAEFITFTLLVNRVTGLYGILALFTGYALNPLQLSNYIYSLVILVLAAWLAPAIRDPRSAPLRIVALAWLYVLDTVINSIYTVMFGLGWFVLLSQHLTDGTPISSGHNALGKGTMADTAGFTDPEVPGGAATVEVFASPAKGTIAAQDAVAFAVPSSATTLSSRVPLQAVAMQPDSLTSITLLAVFGICRVYFCLVILSYARSMLRGYVASMSVAPGAPYSSSADSSLAENPFRAGRDEASLLGRVMTSFPMQSYWLGRDDAGASPGASGEWERLTSGKFEAATAKRDLRVTIPRLSHEAAAVPGGVSERERRARSGTGPPPPELAAAAAASVGVADGGKEI